MKKGLLQGILKRVNTGSVSTVFARFQQCLNYGSDKITEVGTSLHSIFN